MSANANAALMLDGHVQAGRGERLAYVTDSASLTYAQLLEQANRMGNLLRELGVRREERVLLVLDDTLVFPVAFMGALRIGAVPVPVSVREHAENFRHFVEDSYTRLAVCDAKILARLSEALADRDVSFLSRGAQTGAAIELDAALAAQEPELSAVTAHPDDMAFWLYTSGSTGRPKGVVHMHKTIGATCEAFGRGVLDASEQDRIFSTTKLYHAYGLGNALSYPLYFGACAILLEGPPAPERLLATLRRHRPTIYFSVPALYRQLAADADADERTFAGVRLCISAGETLPARTFERCRERFGIEVLDGIGATEMIVNFCSNLPGDAVPGTTGRPIPGYELRLIDDEGHEVQGPGVGTLEVRGPSRAACYWHQQERTRRVMRGEWYASGDRFARRADGRYAYLGRADDMLKVGGLWVSPLDVEQALLEHPAVAGAAVVGASVDDYTRLVAFVERDPARQAGGGLAEELREHCRGRLREYEYPHLIRFVDELPRTLTGKPQRFKLREEIERELSETAAGPATVSTGGGGERDTLELVLGELATLLGEPAQDIDPEAGFVELGVDSLMAVELRNRLASATGLALASTLAFDHATPALAAEAIEAERDGREPPPCGAEQESLQRELERLDRRPARTRMPPAPLAVRLRTSPVVRRLLPVRVAVQRAEQRAAAIWELSEAERTAASRAIEAIVAGTPREGDLQKLARAHFIERRIDTALFWAQPWTAAIDADSRARAERALDAGRGVILSACHQGPYYRLDRAAPFRRRVTYLVPGPWFFDDPPPNHWGRRLARWRKGTGSRPLRATGSFMLIQRLLERGEAVFLFFDQPGPRQTRFLGKPVMLAEGTAQLSRRSGALVLPVRSVRAGHGVRVEVGEALDPHDFAGVDELHEALARLHESWILQDPAAVEDPRSTGWQDGATPQAWVGPGQLAGSR